MVELSICIVTFKACDYLEGCLKSIFTNRPRHSIEVIVVDNLSADGTVEMLASKFPEVIVLQNQSNDGYTRPMNQALRRGTGQVLVQLNPDTILQPDSLDIVYDYMLLHPEIGICIPKILNGDGSMQWQCRRGEARPWEVLAYFTGLSRLFPKNPFFSGYLLTHQSPDEIYEVKAVSGSCMFIRRDVLEKIGYLDELFFAFQEDTDFCFRTRLAGWKIIYYPLTIIIHFGAHGGTRVHPYRSAYEWHRSYFRYYKKWLAKDYFFLLNWLFYGLMLAKLAFAFIKIFFSREKIPSTPKPA